MGKKYRQYDLIETKAYFSKRSKLDGFVIDTAGHLLFVRCLNNVITAVNIDTRAVVATCPIAN